MQGLALSEEAVRATDWRREGPGDGRAEGVSARRQREQAAVSRMPDVDGMHTQFLKVCNLEVCM